MGFFDFLFKRRNNSTTENNIVPEDRPIFKETAKRKDEEKSTVVKWYEERCRAVKDEFPFLKNNPYEPEHMDESVLKQKIRIINESGQIIDKSKNLKTRISRCELCIRLLFEICACNPSEREYAQVLSNAITTMKELVPGYTLDPDNIIPKPQNDYGFNFDEEPVFRQTNAPKVDGKPVYEYAETHKQDFQMMYRCCLAVIEDAQKTKEVPAPFYFWRCAVLAKKEKRYDIEVKVCQSYLEFVDRFSAEMVAKGKKLGHGCLDMNGSPRVADMRKRLPKAIANLEKSKSLPK